MRSATLIFLGLGVAALGLSGCGGRSHADSSARQWLVYSPNGQPLGVGACPDLLNHWLVALAGEGGLTRERFFADAERQFAAMDLDHDGFITAAELSIYRRPFQPATAAPRSSQQNAAALDGSSAPPPGSTHSSGRGARHSGGARDNEAGRASPLGRNDDQPDPVMAADSNLDFKVSRDEFLTQAALVFKRLDQNGDGVLSPAEATTWCPPSP